MGFYRGVTGERSLRRSLYAAHSRYYSAQGYQEPYRWAHNDQTPFNKLIKSLKDSRVGLVTTAMPDTKQGRERRDIYSTPVTPIPETMYTEELSWHKAVTHTNDISSFLPIQQLNILKGEGKIKDLASRFHSLPTDYSQKNTLKRDAPEILRRLREDEVDVAILVPL